MCAQAQAAGNVLELIKEDEGEELSGAEILLRCLIQEGVERIFGYPGGAVLPIYDSLYSSALQHILTRHEQGAIHAADGYARATGKPGVVIATSGPGATNLVTGIATAHMDFGSARLHYGKCGDVRHRDRCLPGGGYYGYYDADYETQLLGSRYERHSEDRKGSFPHCEQRPSRTRAD